jgi:tellurite resistance protein TerC
MSMLPWFGFLALVLALLALDLGVFNRRPHEVSTREALSWTAVWVAISLAFNGLVYFMYEAHWLGIGQTVGHPLGGKEAALEFFAAYLVEKSLSLDNIFVIALIFDYFRVPARYQHRVLFWGVVGALVLRGIMIAAGLAFIERFDWVVYVFGGLLIVTAAKMLRAGDEKIEPERNPLVRIVRRVYPVVGYREHHFVVREDGRRAVTTLLLALAMVESTDLLFAVDSIPAVFAVTRDPFIVFTSNIFAILGLRSLYFALAAVLERFRYLKVSLVFILAFVGVKMVLTHHYPIPTLVSLAIIVTILLVGIVASVLSSKPTGVSIPGQRSADAED